MARDDDEQGKQPNVEGRHGNRTHAQFMDNLAGRHEEEPANDAERRGDAARPTDDGRHRLREDRQQHDEAEKNSEFNRQRDL